MYDNQVTAALAVCWRIFDHPCGQRLESLLKTETERLRRFGELHCSDEVADKLKKQVDFVEHCGQSAAGEFLCSLSTTDIAMGWREGEPQMGRGQIPTFHSIEEARAAAPEPHLYERDKHLAKAVRPWVEKIIISSAPFFYHEYATILVCQDIKDAKAVFFI